MNRAFGFALVLALGCGGAAGSTGPAGPAGPAGPQGTTGAAGPAGGTTVAGIASSMTCNKVAGPQMFMYQTWKYTNGDRMMTCAIFDNGHEYAASQVCRNDRVCATSGNCLLGYDVDTASAGSWVFTLTPSGWPQAVYSDSTSSANGSGVTFASSDCTTY